MRKRNHLVTDQEHSLQLSLRDLWTLYNDFLRTLHEKRPETRGTYQRALRQFLHWCRVDQAFRFRVNDVERFKHYLTRKKQLADVSVSTYLTALRQFCQYLIDIGFLKENPAKQVGGNKRPMTHSRTPLRYTDVEKLITSIDQSTMRGIRDYAMIKTMLGCGLSEIEMVRANVGDLHRQNGQEIIYVQGKGHDEKDQTVVIPSETRVAMDRYLATREKLSADQPLFLSAGNKVHGKRMTTRGIRERVNYYLKRSGIKRPAGRDVRRVTPYSLRHTAALMMIDAGASLEELRQQMRLGSIATAMIYVNQRAKMDKP